MSEMTTKLKNIERFEDLELGSIRILNSAIAYLTQLESENAALNSRLEEAERIVKVVSDGGCLVCLEGGVGCNVHEGNDCIRRLVKQWRRGADTVV